MHSPSVLEIGWYLFFCIFFGLIQSAIVGLFIYKYQRKKYLFKIGIEEIKTRHETEMLQSQLEIQEQTFSNISREIHDNIGQKLTLVKLRMNTLEIHDQEQEENVSESVRILGEVISDLSDLSRSMSSEMIMQNGLLKAIEFEVAQLKKSDLFNIELTVQGEPVFLEVNKELSLFRVIQESLNNIIKHARASVIHLEITYRPDFLFISIADNGQGFDMLAPGISGSGLRHMRKRTESLGGEFNMNSVFQKGTSINVKIPIYGKK